jgi:hypothetical protein
MHKINKSILFLILFIIALAGCKSREVIQHPANVSESDLNNSLQLVAPQAWNTFKVNKPVDLQITNLSGRSINFDQDFGKNIFVLQNDEFTEVENKMITINGQDIKLKSGESIGDAFRIDIGKKKTIVRIYITGKFEDTNEPVTAYLDITLIP